MGSIMKHIGLLLAVASLAIAWWLLPASDPPIRCEQTALPWVPCR